MYTFIYTFLWTVSEMSVLLQFASKMHKLLAIVGEEAGEFAHCIAKRLQARQVDNV